VIPHTRKIPMRILFKALIPVLTILTALTFGAATIAMLTTLKVLKSLSA
jgi:hypothetical protein